MKDPNDKANAAWWAAGWTFTYAAFLIFAYYLSVS